MDFVVAPEARQDLIEIHNYISNDNPDAGARIIDDIFVAFAKLARRPNMGHLRHDLTTRNVRFWPVHSYLIIYDPNVVPIGIARVLSAYRDITKLME
ncbi:plasmid stabilization system family protein [Asticcacaulis biprosthecium C19]|uniref:Plasmid stabilization system family protein n=1 Tax=Asticcacaulis biprosthecium C19 TaxID=715226 RepID=F4QLK8_9CAUL|nr:type II toxin-antitoxin system RelE/ParE family toxin [Asticcacaulis biprosthecium]EGF93506.1 plasmid stabilization system family protein [Asticcacaulis biprosthecium C19]